MTDDLADLFHRAVGHPEGIAPAAVRTRVVRRRRRRATVASLAGLAVVAVIAGVLVRSGDDSETVVVGDSAPATTVLPPPGDDPTVTCSFPEGPWFPARALDGPAGAESAPGEANDLLREVLDEHPPGDPEATRYPQTGWREVSRTEDLVVFVAPTGSSQDELGAPVSPYIAVEVGRFFDHFIVTGGGSCHPWTAPPEGLTLAEWRIDPDQPPAAEDTEIHLEVEPIYGCGQAPLTEDEVVGPDVIETEGSVTIRLALDRPQQTMEEAQDCAPGDPVMVPLELTVPLATPLGDRDIVDGDKLPALPVRIPEPPEPGVTQGPVVEFEGALVTAPVHVVANAADAPCEGSSEWLESGRLVDHCLPGLRSTVTFTVDGQRRAVETDDRGWATAVVPDYRLLTATAQADGHWCSTIRLPTQWLDARIILACTPLDDSVAVISGTAEDVEEPQPSLILQEPTTGHLAGFVTADDGTYDAVLTPGTWRVQLASSFGGTTPCTPGTVTVVAGQDQRVDFVCPYTEEVAAQILQDMIDRLQDE